MKYSLNCTSEKKQREPHNLGLSQFIHLEGMPQQSIIDLSGLNDRNVLSQFWRLDIQDQNGSRADSF